MGTKVESIVLAPTSPDMLSPGPGQPIQFTATETLVDGSMGDITNSATWSSSNTAVATINQSGRATLNSTGTTTISAAFRGGTGTTGLTVHFYATSMDVTPQNQTIAPGATLQFKASATLTDGTTADYTNGVSTVCPKVGCTSWNSSDNNIVVVSDGNTNNGSGGLATAASSATGTVTITACFENDPTHTGTVCGSTTLTVQ